MAPKLDRLVPPDWGHYEKYPLQATQVAKTISPVVWGINWYANFDSPIRTSDGRWWIGRGELGAVRGGHAIASPHATLRDSTDWWYFYNQGNQGACVGYSVSRMATWLNRKRYDARWLYAEAQKVDDWPGEDYSGTSVRAGLDVLKKLGHRTVRAGVSGPPTAAEGISAYRWSRSADEVIKLLDHSYGTKAGAIPWNNSWGRSYPRVVWLPGEVAQRLIDEDGEIAVSTDR